MSSFRITLIISCVVLQIVFDYPSEILTHLTGYYGPAMMMGPNVIKSLSFHTTKDKYGPYGEEQGEFFTTKIKEGPTIVGFHGRKGLFLDAVGVHVLEAKLAQPGHNKNVVVPSVSKNSASPVSPSISNNQTALVTKKVDPSKNVAVSSASPASPSKSNNQTALVTKKVDFKIGKRGQSDHDKVHANN